MKNIPEEELSNILEAGSESISTEFKPAFDWNKKEDLYQKERTIKAILALSNTKGGGYVVVGIKEGSKQLEIEGVETDKWSSPEQLEKIRSDIESFSYATVNVEIARGEAKSKKESLWVIVFGVREFTKTPIICKKDGQQDKSLKKFDIYCRTIRDGMVSSNKVTHDELEAIIEMATDKDREEFSNRLEGLLGGSKIMREATRQKGVEEKDEFSTFYAEQIKDMEEI